MTLYIYRSLSAPRYNPRRRDLSLHPDFLKDSDILATWDIWQSERLPYFYFQSIWLT